MKIVYFEIYESAEYCINNYEMGFYNFINEFKCV